MKSDDSFLRKYKLLVNLQDYDWFLALFDDAPHEVKLQFLQQVYKELLGVDTLEEAILRFMDIDPEFGLELAQKIMQVDSPLELAQKVLQADLPLELALKAMQVDSPVELALKFIQTEEQLNEVLARLQQTSYQTARLRAAAPSKRRSYE